jgi:deferrochelatase/peroxidase EfeB
VGFSRRRFLVTGAVGSGALAAGAAGFAVTHRSTSAGAEPDPGASAGVEPFHGPHQAGITTAQQDRLLFAAYDLTAATKADVAGLLADWTAAAARMTEGLPVDGRPDDVGVAPPSDTGEARGLDPAHLTITFGFGPGLFSSGGVDRYELAARRPEALADLPPFPGDDLDPGRSGGDMCVQACSNDPQVAYHAVRNLTRIGRGRTTLRWVQEGFGRTASTTPGQVTPRNLMGFKDGTENIRAGEPHFDERVWVAPEDGPDWMVGGSYLVARRIRMHIEVWDRSSLDDQERTIGRVKHSGAPLGARREHDSIDLDAVDDAGAPVVSVDAHVRLAHQASQDIFLLRRGYSFTDGIDPQTGQLDAGLFFLAYQRDPRAQFVPLQKKLAQQDALNEYIQHVGSALFAVPPGAAGAGGAIGAALFNT